MNTIRQALAEFLASSTPEQLQAELSKGYRPILQKLDDPVLRVVEPMFTLPATVSFFQGEFAEGQTAEIIDTAGPAYATCDTTGAFVLAA
jgi:hypothetical protein